MLPIEQLFDLLILPTNITVIMIQFLINNQRIYWKMQTTGAIHDPNHEGYE